MYILKKYNSYQLLATSIQQRSVYYSYWLVVVYNSFLLYILAASYTILIFTTAQLQYSCHWSLFLYCFLLSYQRRHCLLASSYMMRALRSAYYSLLLQKQKEQKYYTLQQYHHIHYILYYTTIHQLYNIQPRRIYERIIRIYYQYKQAWQAYYYSYDTMILPILPPAISYNTSTSYDLILILIDILL